MPLRDHLVLILLIAAATLFIYSDSCNNDFVYDDYPFVVENPAIRSLGAKDIMANFTDRRTVSSDEKLSRDVWRPFVTTSFAVDYRLWGLDARLYRAGNIVLHAVNAILVYVLVFLILKNGFAAFIASLVFALHPAQTEAVAWISGRSNVLFLLFFLAALICHIQGSKRSDKDFDYSLPILFFACALFSKEMAIVLPLILLLYDVHFSRPRTARYYVLYYLPFVLVAAAYLIARYSVLGVIAQRGSWWSGGILANMVMAAGAVAGYARILFVPIGLHSYYYFDTTRPLMVQDAALAAIVLASVIVAYAIFRRKREASFYFLWFFVSLIPVYNIVPLKAVMAERFLYLPMVGYAALFGMAFIALMKDTVSRPALRILLAALLIVTIAWYGGLTICRNAEWRTEISFYTQEALRSPENPKAHCNLGYAYAKEAARLGTRASIVYYLAALDEYHKAAALKPDSQIAYLGLGNACAAIGQYGRAIVYFNRALGVKEHPDIYNNLGAVYCRKKEYDNALAAFRKALALDPCHAEAAANLAGAYGVKGDAKKAGRARERADRLQTEEGRRGP